MKGGERLMACCEVGKIINEADAGGFAIVRGIGGEETRLIVDKGGHTFTFIVESVEVSK